MEMNSSGDAVIAWRYSESVKVNLIQAVTVDLVNQKWSSPITLSRSGGNATNVDIAIDWMGNAIAVWQNKQTIESSSYKKSSEKWKETKNLSGSPNQAVSPTAVMNAKGDCLVMWNA